MTGFDFVILAVVLISALAGLVRGFLREVCSLVTWILAVWLAWHLGPSLEPWMGGALRQEPYGLWAGRGIVFLAVLIIGTIVGTLVSHFIRLSLFSGTDRFLGFLMGIGRGIVAMAVVVILGQSVQLHTEDWWGSSRLIKQFDPVVSMLRSLAGNHL